MKGGFSFCGTDIADIGLQYAPELESMYVYSPAIASVHDETFDGHTGGYYYGAWREPKEFKLRCFFEDKQLDKGLMTKVYRLFSVGRSGKLVFQRRPWCYYIATVTEPVDMASIYNYENGLITITMKAYFPFAKSDIFECTPKDEYYENIMENTYCFDTAGMKPETEFSNLSETTTILLANPGTERAPVAIAIAGDAGTGVIITNANTGQECAFVAMSKAVTTDAGAYVLCDAINGKTVLVKSTGQKQLAFLYHDYGFMDLEPNICYRNIFAECDGTTHVNIVNNIEEKMTDKYIWLGNEWIKIVSVNEQNMCDLTLQKACTVSGTVRTTIMEMNRITVTPVSTMDLSRLQFIYQPIYS